MIRDWLSRFLDGREEKPINYDLGPYDSLHMVYETGLGWRVTGMRGIGGEEIGTFKEIEMVGLDSTSAPVNEAIGFIRWIYETETGGVIGIITTSGNHKIYAKKVDTSLMVIVY